MRAALQQAKEAFDADEVPVGAVMVCRNQIIGKGRNSTELLHDVTAHAEILAYTGATQYFNNKYMDECTLYVTLEPCVMCAGALSWAQLGKLVFGAPDAKRGFTLYDKILHPRTSVVSGVLASDCSDLIKLYFKAKRD